MLRTLSCLVMALMLTACGSNEPELVADDVTTPTSTDYPQFRGPDRSGISGDKGLLTSWPADGPKVAWKTTGIGGGFSTVAVAGKRVFTLGDHEGKCRLFAIDRSSGKKLWNLEVGRTGGNYSGPRSTPTVSGDLVYALGQYGDLVCANVESGKEVWSVNFKQDFGGNHGHWNYAESPLVDGEQVICTPGGRDATMVALNKKTGRVIWKCAVPSDGAGYSSPVISEAGGVRQYVTLLSNSVVGVRAKDGQLLWRYGNDRAHFQGNTANIPTCIVGGDYVFCAAGYRRGGGLIKLSKRGNRFAATQVYFSRSLANKHGGIIKVGRYLFGDDDDKGRPWCALAKSGKIIWSKPRTRTKGSGSASMTYADGHLYVRYSNAYMALVKATLKGYREVSIFKIPNGSRNSWAHPVVVGGKMYLREQDTLWCYDVKK